MKVKSITPILCVLMVSAGLSTAFAGPLNVGPKAKTTQAKWKGKTLKKQVKQTRRIHKGVQSGQLTKRETRRLVRQQKHIQKTKKRMIRNDGKLSKTERKVLRLKQRRASRNIYRAKHNRRVR